ncbi:MAG: hypothetical protein Unbinned3325contig1000_55 [Prokaryotic dsDNA virus sp.]|nr:MAG: hypothetical protein Unbinned3325contig1000_55 [Prokaryotic dsDNA virus sp.]|tara:strand:- start:2048 stop:3346 length:1299 start_codon:yes stop_codon:yes gene_type:complete
MIQRVLKDKLLETKLMISHARRNEIRKHLDYYSGTSTEQYITNYFNGDAFREIPPSITNFTRKFINKISRIYSLGAKRNSNERYNELIPTKDVRMKHSERMTRLLGTVANRVHWRDGFFDYRPIYYFEAYFDDDPFVPTAIVYPLLNKTSDLSNTDNMQWEYWDSEKYGLMDEEGKMLSEVPNPYGIIPFVFTHREDQIDSFFVEGASDIVNCNEQVNIALTEMNLGMRFNMFGQPWVTGLRADQSMLRAGSNTILDMGEDGAYNITSPQGNVMEAIENIKFQMELIAINNHLWIQFAESGGEVPSGISLMIKDMERKEDYYDDIALWRMYEREFYDVERVIASYNGIELPEEFGVDFEEIEYPKTVQDQILKDQFDIQNNLTTRAKIMVRDNKDLTISQAQEIINENRGVNEQEGTQSIFERFRQETGQDQ